MLRQHNKAPVGRHSLDACRPTGAFAITISWLTNGMPPRLLIASGTRTGRGRWRGARSGSSLGQRNAVPTTRSCAVQNSGIKREKPGKNLSNVRNIRVTFSRNHTGRLAIIDKFDFMIIYYSTFIISIAVIVFHWLSSPTVRRTGQRRPSCPAGAQQFPRGRRT